MDVNMYTLYICAIYVDIIYVFIMYIPRACIILYSETEFHIWLLLMFLHHGAVLVFSPHGKFPN